MKQLAFLIFLVSMDAVIYAQENSAENETEGEETEAVEGSGEEALEKRGDSTMSNIGYLFRGYNVLEGNPIDPDKSFDPGFKSKIFKATYTKDRRTDDQRYKIPDFVDIFGKTSCSSTFSSDTVMTVSEYQKSLMAKASVSGSAQYGVAKGSFSASTEYNRMKSALESNTKSIIKTEATCTVYEGRIQTGTPPEFTENFLRSVEFYSDSKEYDKLLDTFGTHFVEAVEMGARYTKLQELSKRTQEKLQKEGIDVKVSAEVSAAGVGSLSASAEVQKNKENKEKFEKSVENTKVVTVGSKPPSDGRTETWIAATVSGPLPVFYRLKSITELFSELYFKDSELPIATIKSELSEYLQGYCKKLKRIRMPNVECEGPSKGCGGGNQCSVNANCVDAESSEGDEQQYQCTCKSGYEGNGKICNRRPMWAMTSVIQQSRTKGMWGTWGGMEYCRNGVFAKGFLLIAHGIQGRGDDTGANGVCLKCDDSDVCSKIGTRGRWSEAQLCGEGAFLSGWRQNVEGPLGSGDDTALDNVEYRCRDIETWTEKKNLKTKAEEWGKWSRWKECPRGQFICGIDTRVEDPNSDDTALNDIKHQCCKPVLKKKKAMSHALQKGRKA